MRISDVAAGALGVFERRKQADAYKTDPAKWVYDHLGLKMTLKQREIAQSLIDNRGTLVASAHGQGKGLALDTPIPTPTGWTTMGELKVGDEVFDEAGNPTTVTYKSPVHNIPCYRVTFNDGATLITDNVHLWETIDPETVTHLTETGVGDWREHWDSAETRKVSQDLVGHLIPVAGEKVSGVSRGETTFRVITEVAPVDSVPTQCITVDSPRSLYLAGEEMIPTHNTFSEALLGLWWVNVFYDSGVFLATTAPSAAQVNIFWDYLKKFHGLQKTRYESGDSPTPPIGYITGQNQWKDDEGIIIGEGRKPPEDKSDVAFQGRHAPYLLAIADECHDDQTDILTDRGWLRFEDLTDQDRVLTMDPDTGESYYVKPTRRIKRWHDGDMYHYSTPRNRGGNYMVTPGHEMWARTRKAGFRKVTPDKLNENYRMSRTVTGFDGEITEHVIPELITERKVNPERRVGIVEWARFYGWFASEGSIDALGYSTHITQLPGVSQDAIVRAVNAAGFTASVSGKTVIVGGGGAQLARHLRQWGRTCDVKRLDPEVFSWPREAIEAFLEAYRDGDGYRKDDMTSVLYTSCEDMASDLHALALLAGYNSTQTVRKLEGVESAPLADGRRITSSRDGYAVSMSTSGSELRFREEYQKVIHYEGYVYCVEVPPTRLIYTRRNGHALWSGNCVGVPKNLIDAMGNLATGDNNRQLLVANPTTLNCEMYRMWKLSETDPDYGKNWNRVTISVLDSPLIKEDPYLPAKEADGMAGWAFYDQKLKDYGSVDDPRFMARVLGQWAQDEGSTVFTVEEVSRAMDTVVIVDDTKRKEVGVDISGLGDDYSVVYLRETGEIWTTSETGEPLEPTGKMGFRFRQIGKWNKTPLAGGNELRPDSAMKVNELVLNYGAQVAKIDASGIGMAVIQGITGSLNPPYTVVSVFGGAAARDPRTYVNSRAELFFDLKLAMQRGEIDIDPDDDMLREQMETLRYEENENKKIKIESKDSMRRRGVKSPDELDTVAYAFKDVDDLFEDRLDPGEQILLDLEDLEFDKVRNGFIM